VSGADEPLYSERVRQLFAETPRAGVLTGGRGLGVVRTGRAGGRGQGVEVEFSARISEGRVVEVRFRALGCPYTIAAAAAVAAAAEGAELAQAQVDPQALALDLGVPRDRLGRLLVVQDALAACLHGDAT
jgi:NifU-like protein involved in Fe-S cluster formation